MAEEIGSNKYYDFDMCEDRNWEEQKRTFRAGCRERKQWIWKHIKS